MALDPTAGKPPATYLRLGRLGRTFQLEGALRLLLDEAASYAYDDDAPVGVRAIRSSGSLFVAGLGNVRVRRLYESGGALLLQLEGVRERNAAQALVNAVLWVDPARLPEELAAELTEELEAGSAEDRLLGLPVMLNGVRVGEVSAALLGSPNPVLEVTLPAAAGPRRSLVPLQAPYVELTETALELTDPPEGLLEPR